MVRTKIIKINGREVIEKSKKERKKKELSNIEVLSRFNTTKGYIKSNFNGFINKLDNNLRIFADLKTFYELNETNERYVNDLCRLIVDLKGTLIDLVKKFDNNVLLLNQKTISDE